MLTSSLETIQPQCEARSIGVANQGVTTLLQVLLAAFCEISTQKWPPDYGAEYINKRTETFDFIVVGGGTAGSVIAGRLSENPNYRVLLIEAGDNPPVESEIPGYFITLQHTKYDWDYQTISNKKSCLAYPRGACVYPRGKMIGGSSGINLMIYIFGNRQDFSIWEKLGNPTWGYDEVLKYYQKAENYLLPNPYNVHRTGGPLNIDRCRENRLLKQVIIRGAQEGGYEYVDDFRDDHFLGFGVTNALLVNGTRNTPAKAFIKNPKPNLKIIRNAIGTRINFNNKKRASSVTFIYKDKDNDFHELEARNSKEIILSAGAMESPKLLMLSGVGPRESLEALSIPVINNSPGVGHNFQDHVYVELYFRCKPIQEQHFSDDMYNYLIHRRGNLASIRLADTNGFLNIGNRSEIYPNIQVVHLWYAKGSNVDNSPVNPTLKQTVNAALKQSAVLSVYVVILNPKSKGFLTLASNDYRYPPKIYPNFLSVDDDVKLLIGAIRKTLELQYTPTFKENGIQFIESDIPTCSHFHFDSDAYWECYIRHNSNMFYHPVGTAKMGPDSDPSAVVDYRLRVKGVKRVRVVDASIMPTVVSANTQASTVAIAEKAADFIKHDWSHLH